MSDKHMQRILRDIYMRSLAERHMMGIFDQKESPQDLHWLEHDPRIKTSLTDKDMLLLHIDMALDAGDVDAFMGLIEALKSFEDAKS